MTKTRKHIVIEMHDMEKMLTTKRKERSCWVIT